MTPQEMQQEEKAFAEDLVGKIIAVQLEANRVGNLKLVKELQELTVGVLYVQEILWAFRRFHKQRRISDVTNYLGLTRPGLHHRIKKLGLSTDDFTVPDASLEQLVRQKSPTLSRLVKTLDHAYAQPVHV